MDVTQVADTCVRSSDCEAIHPLESTSTNIQNFSIDIFGSCNIDLIIISFDICDALDSLIAAIIEGPIEGAISDSFEDGGNGTLIEVFSNDIKKDGCANIPEVGECNQGGATVGLVRGPETPSANAGFYAAPLVVIGGVLMLRRRRRQG